MRVLVDGSRNPELIPDQRAVRMLMLQLASSPDGARRARLAQSAFSDDDLAALTAALGGLGSRIVELQGEGERVATGQPKTAETRDRLGSLSQALSSSALDTYAQLQDTLTADGRAKLRAAVELQKRTMVLFGPSRSSAGQ